MLIQIAILIKFHYFYITDTQLDMMLIVILKAEIQVPEMWRLSKWY